MTRPPRRAVRTRVAAVAAAAVFAMLFAGTARADSWAPPQSFRVRSDNGRFTAVVNPGGRGKTASVRIVDGKDAPGKRPVREFPLSNGVAPTDLMVSDDGRHVVTFDNWYGMGRGDDVLAFYEDGRQTGKFSLEQILPENELARVPASTMSRHWRATSVDLLQDLNGRRYLCIWLGTVGRWEAWDVSAGGRVDVARVKDLSARCDAAARERALAALREEPAGAPAVAPPKGAEPGPRKLDRVTAVHVLAFVRNPADRPVVERQLAASDDYFTATTYRSDGQNETMGAAGSSETRKAADHALAEWDGRAAAWRAARRAQLGAQAAQEMKELAEAFEEDARGEADRKAALEEAKQAVAELRASRAQEDEQTLAREQDDRYYYLCTVTATVRLSEQPRVGTGGLCVYLVPDGVPAAQWAASKPVHRVRLDFTHPGLRKDWPQEFSVEFAGVTPGRYWVKAVYDRAAPFGAPAEFGPAPVCSPSPGDDEGEARDAVNVKPGETYAFGEFACTRRVPKAD